MIRKLCIALVAVMLIAAIIPQSMAASDKKAPPGVQPYKGLVGADSPFYGFKLFAQKVDISLTGNTSIRLHKMLAYGDERLAEACAMAIANNTGALEAALNEYARQLQAINSTMDDESVDEISYIEAGQKLDGQESNLTEIINNSTITPAAQELLSQTLDSTQEIKSGRPFIYFNNTSYFIPPGQMKKLDWDHVPPGLAKKGYVAPAPMIINGTVLWPWDEGYSISLNSTGNSTTSLNSGAYILPVKKNGKAKASGNGNGNGSGKK